MSLCSTFSYYYEDDWRPCTCPACKGFLPHDMPLDKQFLCKKCGKVLKTMPPLDEWMSWDQVLFDFDPNDYKHGGRICVVPEAAITISTELPPKRPRTHKKGTDLWATGIGFSRRVWEDRGGRFINIDGERIDIHDPRILNTYEDPVEVIQGFQ